MIVSYIIIAVLGLIAGSFVNALVWRLHQQEQGDTSKELSISRGRSMCPHCRHQLSGLDLIPVFSWLSLRGKCRYCHKPIGKQYPLVEVLTALLFVFAAVFWDRIGDRGIFPSSGVSDVEMIGFGFSLIFIAGFVALAVYDLKWMLLPNKIIFSLMGLAILEWLLFITADYMQPSQIWQIGLAAMVGGGFFYVLFQLSAGAWIGGGDVKLGFLLGLFLGEPIHALLVIFVASLLGSLVSVPILLTGKAGRKTRIPFGPFLLAAAYLVILFGTDTLEWYGINRLMQ